MHRLPRWIFGSVGSKAGKIELLAKNELPAGFQYPRQFESVLRLGLIHIEPWHMLGGLKLRQARSGLAERYPKRDLVPFAYRQDNDDIACWQMPDQEKVVIIHDLLPADGNCGRSSPVSTIGYGRRWTT